jgi:hypothetical protein
VEQQAEQQSAHLRQLANHTTQLQHEQLSGLQTTLSSAQRQSAAIDNHLALLNQRAGDVQLASLKVPPPYLCSPTLHTR